MDRTGSDRDSHRTTPASRRTPLILALALPVLVCITQPGPAQAQFSFGFGGGGFSLGGIGTATFGCIILYHLLAGLEKQEG